MGQAGFTIAGQVIGSYFGPVGAAVGGMVGSAIGGALFPTDLGRHEGPRLSDLRSQVSTYGASVPVVYGRCGLAGCVIWADDLREVSVEEDIGGKGGPATEGTSVSYSYFASFAVAICAGEMATLSRIWVNGKCFYDVRDESNSEAIAASSAFAEFFTWYPGSETQDPDPTMEAALGAGNVPAYRGVCYIVFHDVPLELFHNAPIGALNCQFEVTRVGTPTTGVRVIESDAGGLLGDLIYPVVDGTIRLRDAFIAGRTNVHRFDATAVSSEAETEDEAAWPGPYLWLGDNTNGVMRTPDGATVRATVNPGNFRFDSGSVDIYAQPLGESLSGGKVSALGLFTPTEYYFGCVPAADLHHVCVFSNTTSGGTPTKYYLIKWDIVSGEWTLTASGTMSVTITGLPVGSAGQGYGSNAGCMESDLRHVWTFNSQSSTSALHLWVIDAVTGAMTELDTWLSPSPTFAGSCTIWADDGLMWSYILGGEYFMFTRLTGTGPNTEDLADVVTDICARCGLSPSQIDVTDLIGIAVDGFMWAGVTPGRAALEHLRRVYWFDTVESGGQIKFVLRGGDPVETITADYLGASEGGNPVLELIKTQRADEDTLPAFLSVAYLTKDADYQPGVQSAQRSATVSEQPSTMELPLVLSDTDARRVADVLLYDNWVGRNRRLWATSRAYSHLEPADIVTLEPDETTSYQVRITSIQHRDGMIAFEGVDEDAAIYDQTSLGGTIEDEAPVTLAGPTKAILLDIPALLDTDDDPGYYAAAAGYLTGWPGARLFRSDDGGANYTSAAVFFDAATMGYAYSTDILGDYTGGNFYDASNTLRVTLLSGSLTSVTDAQLLAGANAAAIGNPTDGWEIVQFRDVSYSGGVYTLSMFLRGRKGTEHKQATHVANESFVLLTVAGLQRLADSVGALNSERIYRAVTFGARLADTSPQTFTNTGLALECYSPVHPAATGWGGDLTLSWVRRARIANGWNDGVDVPLGEDTESYEVDIYDSGNTTVLRTLTSSTQSVAYTSAQQTTDHGAPVSSLNIRIYQMSADVGRGIPCIVTLTD
jgi:hypothetical protein